MKKKTLISVSLVLAALIFVYVLVTFIAGLTPVAVVAEGETATFGVQLHQVFADQYQFMLDNFAFLIVIFVFFAAIIALTIKYLVPKKIGSKKYKNKRK